MENIRTLALIIATISMGLMAGAFALYAHTIMPALGRVDNRTFLSAFQALDRAIINPWFLGGGFVGALVFTLMAAILHRESKALPWVVTALLLYATAFLVTLMIHLPLNDALKAAGDPDRITDLGAVRRAFNEPRWASWNVVRAATTTLAFALHAWALVVHGKST